MNKFDGSVTYSQTLSHYQNTLHYPDVTKLDLGNICIEFWRFYSFGTLYEGVYFENFTMSASARNNIISLGIANAENIEANYVIYPVPDSNYIRVLSDRQNVTFYCYVVYEK